MAVAEHPTRFRGFATLPLYDPAAAEAVDLPIYVHPGMPEKPVSTLILSGALDRHPNLKLLSGHWGELVAGWLDRVDEVLGWTNHLDRLPSAYYREQVWVTPSGMFNQNQLNYMVAEIGADRIVYSEDFPYVVRDNVTKFLEQAHLSDEQRNTIAHGNAESLLRI
jgi:predicted TIM-barrel fold metal-dependent hydrolase